MAITRAIQALTEHAIVCQPEADIPPEVCQLRDWVRRYMVGQGAILWSAIIMLGGYLVLMGPASLLMFSVSQPRVALLLGIAPNIFGLVVLVFTLYLVLLRWLAPAWIEKHYEVQSVLVEVKAGAPHIGRFSGEHLCRTLAETCNRMGFIVDPGLFLYRKDSSAANAFFTNLVDHHTKLYKVVLLKNLLFIMSEEELRAVVAHELGHMLQPWPAIYRSARYVQTCELLADYNALLHAGLLPTVNALVKIYARADYLAGLWELVEEQLLERGAPAASLDEVLRQANLQVKQRSFSATAPDDVSLIISRKLRRAPGRPYGFWQRLLQRWRLRDVRRSQQWRRAWKRVPVEFTAAYGDRHITAEEFQRILEGLRQDPEADLFVPNLPRKERSASHPSLRRRLLFLAQCAERLDAAGTR